MGSCPQDQLQCCFKSWVNQQQHDLEELNQALRSEDGRNEEKLRFLTQKNIKHFQDYHERRLNLLKSDPPSSFSPTWCTPFENSFLWITSCRPTLAIQLVYTLCGLELEAHLEEFLQGVRRGNMGELSAGQLEMVNELHCRTVREEEEISNRLARLQEDIGEEELGLIMEADEEGVEEEEEVEVSGSGSGSQCQSDGYVMSRAVESHAKELGCVLEDADRLRLETMKELLSILSPLQAVDLLVAVKKLYLSMHDWGTRGKDSGHGEHYGKNPRELGLSL